MPIRLSIEAESVEEFDTLIARFSRLGETAIAAATMPEVRAAAAEAEKPAPAAKPARKGAKAAEPTQNPDGSPITPVSDPVPQPTPGGTDAPPAESIPPKQETVVDPFAAPAADTSTAAAGTTASAQSAAETVAATPAATSPADTAAAAGGEVTVQQLKDAMADLLKAKSASFAMATLEAATGCKSLTSGSPSVVEKAKDDPAIMRRTLDALVAAKTAA